MRLLRESLLALIFASLATVSVQAQDTTHINLQQLLAILGPGGYQIPVQLSGSSKTDLLVSRLDTAYWHQIATGNHPAIHIYGTPFDVKGSEINGVGLFTGTGTSYQEGDTIMCVFARYGTSGKFRNDYMETPPATFVNDNLTPNTRVVFGSLGVHIVATQQISSGTEITSNYRELIALFPGDSSVESTIRYW